jgi:hypothetical protein
MVLACGGIADPCKGPAWQDLTHFADRTLRLNGIRYLVQYQLVIRWKSHDKKLCLTQSLFIYTEQPFCAGENENQSQTQQQ